MQHTKTTLVRLATFVLATTAVSASTLADGKVVPQHNVDYERDIKPMLLHKCTACHGALKQNSGLRLDAGELIRKGSDNGPVVQPGQISSSLLIARVTAADVDIRMPPEGQGERLSEAQVDLLKAWIDQGANSPTDEKIPEDPARYWSYQSPVRPVVPVVQNQAWVRNPIDAFISAEQENRGLLPSEDASREVWLRRVTLDLIGLPPSRDELHLFLDDSSVNAYETVVDMLLARPEYGERWGRHWMDVWRYSDWYGSRGGNEIRYSQRHIWRWRDWIVESLNNDKPYDQMVVEMLAGDEFAPDDPDILRATGFLGRNWYKFDRNVWMFETVEHSSQAFLGLTLKCARCHDHKFDPITQEDYYHFRAFFEPHDVRTDPVSGNAETEKDATLGPVLKEGVARVFDKTVDAKTFVFQRGDNRYPDESKLMTPAVPKALGALAAEIQPVSLSPESYYPQLLPAVADGLIAAAEARVEQAGQQIDKARGDADQRGRAVMELQARIERGEIGSDLSTVPVLHDEFASRSEVWKVVSGDWFWQDGKLLESSVGSFTTLMADVTLPRDFQARVKYRTLQPGTFRSVGFSFDYVDQGNSQDVYTSSGDAAQSIQAFHRRDGQQDYPQAGIVATKLSVGEVSTVEITARGQQLTLVLNGEHKLDYVMPVPRRKGKFALWVHNGSAEFLEVDVRELVPTVDDLRQQHQSAVDEIELAEASLVTARDEVLAIRARIIAERAKYHAEPEDSVRDQALVASRAERQVAVSKTMEAVLAAEHLLARIRESASPSLAAAAAAVQVAAAEQKLSEANQKLTDARMALAKADGTYLPLGEVFPATSTGRRLALARWITSPQNPRASRIAVNHLWLRHMGEALVPSVANFGLNGQRPSHPELLDWLATELTANGWKMKPLHRMIVLSSTYRQSSATGLNSAAASANAAVDPANRFLWRMNSRRMEAEVVRDSVLSVAGSLDKSQGGPEIPETEAQSVLRRSLYFRNTPNEKVGFLETFDVANPNECYRRQESVVPQQALALMNSSLTLDQARLLAEKVSAEAGTHDIPATRDAFITIAFQTILSRIPDKRERAACQRFLEHNTGTVQSSDLAMFPAGGQPPGRAPAAVPHLRARENLMHVLFSHNDFVTIR